MKTLVALLAFAAGIAHADSGDYAWAWPLSTEGDAGVWQVELAPAQIAASADPQLADISVVNAADEAVPVAWLPVDLAAVALSDTVALPVFTVPASRADGIDGAVHLDVQRGSDGRLQRIAAKVVDPTATGVRNDVIVDASAAIAQGARLQRLRIDWPAGGPDRRLRVAVDASDDLEHWDNRVAAATVLQLRRDGAELSRRSITFETPVARPYLRLRVLDGELPAQLDVHADRIADGPTRTMRRWIDATIGKGDKTVTDAASATTSTHRYTLPAALPVAMLDIGLVDDNSIATLRVSSRRHATDEWRPRATITAFRLRDGGSALVNDPLQLASEERAAEWQIEATPAQPRTPTVRMGYRPDRIAFLAQGLAPYRLVAGSVTARRSEAPVDVAIDEWRSRHGADWQPPQALSGERVTLAGQAAYREPQPPLPWRRIALWTVLVIAAATIVLFALRLLREPRKPDA